MNVGGKKFTVVTFVRKIPCSDAFYGSKRWTKFQMNESHIGLDPECMEVPLLEDKRMDLIKNEISEKAIIDLLEELVNIPSYPGIPDQETGVAERIQQFFASEGIESEVTHVVDGRSNVTARLKGKGGGKSLLLTGHTDTVPPYDMEDPCQMKIRAGNLVGRGVVDMKGALACMMTAMAAIKRSGINLKGDVVFAGVIDEEEKSEGTRALLKSGINTDAAVVGEPFEWDIGIGQKGLEWFELQVHGKAIHGGKQEEGINAIAKAAKLIQTLDEKLVPKINSRKHPIIGSSSMNYGMIKGGFQPSTVAGECLIQFDRRWVPGEKYEEIIREYQDVLDFLHGQDPEFKAELKVMDVSVMETGYIHEAMEIELDHPIVELAESKIFEIAGVKPKKLPFPAWTDAGLLSSYGKIPTIILGPGNPGSAHTAHEFLEISCLVPFAVVYAAIAADFCK